MSSIATSQPQQCLSTLFVSTFRRTPVSKEELAAFARFIHKHW